MTVRRVVASHALAAVGMSLPWPLLVLLVWEGAGDGWVLGVAGAARMLPYVVLSWAAGRLADRFARDRIVRLTLVARLVLLLGVGVALAADLTWAALAAATLAIAVGTPAYPALAAAMPALAGRGSERATGLLVTVEVASFTVGPAVGGLLLAPATRGLVPWVAVGCLAAAWALFDRVRLAVSSTPAEGARGSGVVRAIRSSARLRGAIGAVAAVNAVAAVVGLALLPLLGDGAAFGVATGALGFGALGGPLLGRLGDRWGVGIRTWLLVLAGCVALVVAVPSLAWAVPAAGRGRCGGRAGGDRRHRDRAGRGAGPVARDRAGRDGHRDGRGRPARRPGRRRRSRTSWGHTSSSPWPPPAASRPSGWSWGRGPTRSR